MLVGLLVILPVGFPAPECRPFCRFIWFVFVLHRKLRQRKEVDTTGPDTWLKITSLTRPGIPCSLKVISLSPAVAKQPLNFPLWLVCDMLTDNEETSKVKEASCFRKLCSVYCPHAPLPFSFIPSIITQGQRVSLSPGHLPLTEPFPSVEINRATGGERC